MPVPVPKTSDYDLLGVDSGAGEEEIRNAYKKQALKWHPDRHTTDKEAAQQRFIEIGEAYRVLLDESKHRKRSKPRSEPHPVWAASAPSASSSTSSSSSTTGTSAGSGSHASPMPETKERRSEETSCPSPKLSPQSTPKEDTRERRSQDHTSSSHSNRGDHTHHPPSHETYEQRHPHTNHDNHAQPSSHTRRQNESFSPRSAQEPLPRTPPTAHHNLHGESSPRMSERNMHSDRDHGAFSPSSRQEPLPRTPPPTHHNLYGEHPTSPRMSDRKMRSSGDHEPFSPRSRQEPLPRSPPTFYQTFSPSSRNESLPRTPQTTFSDLPGDLPSSPRMSERTMRTGPTRLQKRHHPEPSRERSPPPHESEKPSRKSSPLYKKSKLADDIVDYDTINMGTPIPPLRSKQSSSHLKNDWVFPLQLALEDLYFSKTHHYQITRTLRSGTTQTMKIDVHISPDWKDGTRIRITGAGNERSDGTFQDIVFVVEVQPHPRFTRVDNDIHVTVHVPWVEPHSRVHMYPPDGGSEKIVPPEDEVYVKGLDGEEFVVTIPRSLVEGADGSRIMGAGMPIRKGDKVIGKGDLVVKWDFAFSAKPETVSSPRARWQTLRQVVNWRF